VIDLRWGITDETTISNLTTNFCVTEIKNCQKESIGPCFAVILSGLLDINWKFSSFFV
jgi:hypothetical protein